MSRIVIPNGNTPRAREELAEICATLAANGAHFEAAWTGGSWTVTVERPQ